jgi:hypothetical protein
VRSAFYPPPLSPSPSPPSSPSTLSSPLVVQQISWQLICHSCHIDPPFWSLNMIGFGYLHNIKIPKKKSVVVWSWDENETETKRVWNIPGVVLRIGASISIQNHPIPYVPDYVHVIDKLESPPLRVSISACSHSRHGISVKNVRFEFFILLFFFFPSSSPSPILLSNTYDPS